jgi:DnaJ-class molecular chaperone
MKPCPTCKGTGKVSRATMDPANFVVSRCEPCQGTGQIPYTDQEREAMGQGALF